MKSPYYVATVINAYRRAIDVYYKLLETGEKYRTPTELADELVKPSHRKYTTGFMFKDGNIRQNLESSVQTQESKFIAIVTKVKDNEVVVEMRNKFSVGDTLEILSPSENFNKKIVITKILDSKGNSIESAKRVQEKIQIFYNGDAKLAVGDILRI